MIHCSVLSDQAASGPKSTASLCSYVTQGSRTKTGSEISIGSYQARAIQAKSYQPFKSSRIYTDTLQTQMREVYEKYNSGKFSEDQLQNELKNRLYVSIDASQISKKIKNNEFNFKELVKMCDQQTKDHCSKVTYNQEYFQPRKDAEKVTNSQNLHAYRRNQEIQNGVKTIEDTEAKKDREYKEYVQKYSSPTRGKAIQLVDTYSKGLITKSKLLYNLKAQNFDMAQIKDEKVRTEQDIDPSYLKNKILVQVKAEHIEDMNYSPTKNPKVFMQTVTSFFKPFSEDKDVIRTGKSSRNAKDDDDALSSASSRGFARMSSLKFATFSGNNKDNGDIITWHGSDKAQFAQQQSSELERIKLKKIKSCEFLFSGLEQLNNQMVPSVKKTAQMEASAARVSSRELRSEVKSEIRQQQKRCFDYDDYISPVKIRFDSHRNTDSQVNILTWN